MFFCNRKKNATAFQNMKNAIANSNGFSIAWCNQADSERVGISLHAPDCDGVALIVATAMPDAVVPGQLPVAVEYDKVAFVNGAYCIQVLPGLPNTYIFHNSLLSGYFFSHCPQSVSERYRIICSCSIASSLVTTSQTTILSI